MIADANMTNTRTGYGTHGDYMFGWKDDSLQRAMDTACYVNCPTLKTQEVADMNACTIKSQVDEDFDGCKFPKFFCHVPTADAMLHLISADVACRDFPTSWEPGFHHGGNEGFVQIDR